MALTKVWTVEVWCNWDCTNKRLDISEYKISVENRGTILLTQTPPDQEI